MAVALLAGVARLDRSRRGRRRKSRIAVGAVPRIHEPRGRRHGRNRQSGEQKGGKDSFHGHFFGNSYGGWTGLDCFKCFRILACRRRVLRGVESFGGEEARRGSPGLVSRGPRGAQGREASPLVLAGGSSQPSKKPGKGARARDLTTNRSSMKLTRFPANEWICGCKSFVLRRSGAAREKDSRSAKALQGSFSVRRAEPKTALRRPERPPRGANRVPR